MADRSAGSITIGGPFPEEHLMELVELILFSDITPEWGDDRFKDVQEVREHLEQIERDGVPLFLASDELSGGEPMSLIDALIRWKVPHANQWDGDSSNYGEGWARYDAERGRIQFPAADGSLCVDLTTLRAAWERNTMSKLITDMEWVSAKFDIPFKVRGPLGRMAEAVSLERTEGREP